MRGSCVSQACSLSRRVRYSASICDTDACGPVSAARAAFCEMDETFEVEWLCRALHAAITGAGPSAQPHRQPVIAYDFDAELVMIVWWRMRSVRMPTRLCGTGS